MRIQTGKLRKPLLAGVCAAAVLASAGVASGAAAVLIDTGRGTSPTGGSVSGTCTGQVGAATDFNRITYAVEAVAIASHRNAGVAAVGTGVVCRIVDTATGVVYGEIRGGAPGPAVPAAGPISFPRTADVKACVQANAVYSDGSTAAFRNC